jgi:peptide deformylase
MIQSILLLGNPQLYQVSAPVMPAEFSLLPQLENDLRDTLMEYRRIHQAGRAIATPQISVQKRVLYMDITEPLLIVNPSLTFPDDEKMQVWDDCCVFRTCWCMWNAFVIASSVLKIATSNPGSLHFRVRSQS